MTAELDVEIIPEVLSVVLGSNPAMRVQVDTPAQVDVLVIPGPPGLVGPNSWVVGEIPTGVQDGVNVAFTLANAYQAESTIVSRNGLRERLNTGYTENPPVGIVFSSPPLPGDDIDVDYIKV
jgi:hypothetical protein